MGRVLQKALGGSIIVFHMNKRGWRTAEVLPGIMAGLRKKGYALVAVDEMPAVKGAATGMQETAPPPGQERPAAGVSATKGAAPVISSGSAAGG